MKPLTKGLILFGVVLFYAFLYIGTTYPVRCEEDCQKISRLDTTLRGKYDYVHWASRCTNSPTSDTLCIWVKDTTGINWNAFADTICLYSNSVGLYQQKLFLIKSNIAALPDTVARKQCP